MINWKLVWSFYLTFLIPFLYFLNILLAFKTPHTFKAPYALSVLGIFLAVCGIIFWITSYINLGSSFGILPQKQKKVKKGLYRYFSHPMYIGIWLTFLGLSLANSSWQGLVFLNLVVSPVLFIRAVLEEHKLE